MHHLRPRHRTGCLDHPLWQRHARWKRTFGFVLFGFVALDILIFATNFEHKGVHGEQLAFGALLFVIFHVMGGIAAFRLDKREQQDKKTSGRILA